MTQYNITLSNEDVHGLFTEDGRFAKLVEKVLNQVLKAQATEVVGALPYERTDTPVSYTHLIPSILCLMHPMSGSVLRRMRPSTSTTPTSSTSWNRSGPG